MIKTFHNTRNETASTDCRIWWRGTSTDATSIALEELQPASALLPQPAHASNAIAQATVAKARAVFISALRKTAPTVAPDDDAERAVLRKAWDDATEFALSHKVISIGQPVFDAHLMVVGTADAVFEPETSGSITYCYAPDGCEFVRELNALVRILHDGLPNAPTECPCGLYDLRSYCRAVTALVLRDQTEWHKRKMDDLPL